MDAMTKANRSAAKAPRKPQNDGAATTPAMRHPGATGGYTVSRMDVARLLLLRYTHQEIADELGHHRVTITDVANEPEVIAEVDRVRAEAFAEATEILKVSTRRAAQRIAKAMESLDERIALDAAKTLLTKAGADAPSQSKAEVTGKDGGPLRVEAMTPAQAKERAAELIAALPAKAREHALAMLKLTEDE